MVDATPQKVAMGLLHFVKCIQMTFNARIHYNVLKCTFISIHGVEAIVFLELG